MASTLPEEHKKNAGVWLLLALLLALCIFIAWGIFKAAFPPAPPLQGQMEARTLSVASKTPGRVAKILVKEGDFVKKGQIVAEMSLPGLEARLEQAEAQARGAEAKESMVDEGARPEQIKAAKAKWEATQAEAILAEKTFKRLDALYKDGLVSAERHDEAKANRDSSQEEARAAKQEYDLVLAGSRKQEKAAAADQSAEARAGIAEVESLTADIHLYAPKDAQVDRILIVDGELTSAGFPVLTLVDIADQWVSFNILEKDMPGIAIGKMLNAAIPAINKKDAEFAIYYISPRASYATWRSTREDSGYDMKTFEVRARPKERLTDLRPGMSVLAERVK